MRSWMDLLGYILTWFVCLHYFLRYLRKRSILRQHKEWHDLMNYCIQHIYDKKYSNLSVREIIENYRKTKAKTNG